MELVTSLAPWRQRAEEVRRGNATVALVPTMGALHAGHVALLATAREQCDYVIATIFVNPRQFNSVADLALYPRTTQADHEICERAGVDLLVEPTVKEMWPNYPGATFTTVSVGGVAERFEGADRPGHFDGVASVVNKLFNVTGECHAYFGEKDFQQLAVVRQMILDLAMPASLVACRTVRDDDGLALSSRNARLSQSGRTEALALAHTVLDFNENRTYEVDEVRTMLERFVSTDALVVAYREVVDPLTLEPCSNNFGGDARVLVAATIEGVRLLDNGPVMVRPSKGVRRATGH